MQYLRLSKSHAVLDPRIVRLGLIVVAIVSSLMGTNAAAAEPSDALRQPGLRTEYLLEGAAPISRSEFVPALLLAPAETPDSRLPASGWKARWTGVIEILQPGNYQFSARASGSLRVRVGDKTVLDVNRDDNSSPAANELIDGPQVELTFGLHPFEVDFEPRGEGAELKLYWESDNFARESLSARNVGHAVAESDNENGIAATISPNAVFASDLYLAGRLAVEEQSCVSCHLPSDSAPLSKNLAKRPGPHLTQAGNRLNEAWIFHWLENPQHLRPEAVMPKLFADDRPGEIERRAVAHFLAQQTDGQNGKAVEAAKDHEKLAAQGKVLFERTGCIACHVTTAGRPARATLRGLGQKTTSACLAEFLQQPGKFDPAGRMPDLKLSAEEAKAIAAYLTDAKTEPIAPLALPEAPTSEEIRTAWLALGQKLSKLDSQSPGQQLAQLGRQVMHERRCTSCHEFKISGEVDFWKARPANSDFARVAASSQNEDRAGCLKSEPSPDAKIPRFAETLNRDAVRAFLAASGKSPGAPAPAESARLTLARFNCQACHERDGVGGLAPDFVNLISANQSAQEAELVKPPTLSGVTEKLLDNSLAAVLTGDRRARPWMSVRMPHFGKEHVGHLPAALAALEATNAANRSATPQPDARLAEAGRQLVGAQGFGCTKCHDLAGKPSGGTRGPDLADVPERIRYDWFQHWMTDPQRIEPGTRMPTVFLKGESPYPNILEGDPALQREAIWQYMVASRELPLPPGLDAIASEAAPLSKRVLVARTFLPDVSPRSMAIRFPSALHLVYDAQSCRLAYAWRGNFLDMTPVWTERGGRQARPMAPIRWRAPGGFPVAITESGSTELPDFAGRATDPSLGAPLPDDAKLHPSRLHFRGYFADTVGATFRYDLDVLETRFASFTERLTTAADETGGRINRQFEFATPGPKLVTLLLADCAQSIQAMLPDEKQLLAVTPKEKAANLPGEAILLVTDEPGPSLFRLAVPANDAQWQIIERDGRWQLLLKLPTIQQQSDGTEVEPMGRASLSLEVALPTDGSAEGVARQIEILRKQKQ